MAIPCRSGGMADASDSKSDVGNNVWVQVPPSAPMEELYKRFDELQLKYGAKELQAI